MGSLAYNFLTESILFDEDNLNTSFKSISENILLSELEKYRNYILANSESLLEDIRNFDSSLKVFSTIDKIPQDTLIQSALYIEQFIIDDPLFKFTNQHHEQSTEMGTYLGYDAPSLDINRIASTLKFLKKITPMIAGDYIKLIPVSLIFEPRKETPIFYSANQFENELPPSLINFFKKNAIVHSMERNPGGGWKSLTKQDYTPGILINFKEGNDLGMLFHYMEQQVLRKIGENSFETGMKLAEYPMEAAVWNNWVKQSINRTAINVVDKVYTEIIIASDLNATYIADNQFTANLIQENFETIENPQTITTKQVLNLNLPFIDKINIQKLMDIRNFEQETFTNFRMELEKNFRELRFISDEKELLERQQNILHELGVVQVSKINAKLGQLKRKALLDSTILIGGLAGSVITSGWSLIGSALAMVSGYKSYIEYKESLTSNPSYLLWKVLKK